MVDTLHHICSVCICADIGCVHLIFCLLNADIRKTPNDECCDADQFNEYREHVWGKRHHAFDQSFYGGSVAMLCANMFLFFSQMTICRRLFEAQFEKLNQRRAVEYADI